MKMKNRAADYVLLLKLSIPLMLLLGFGLYYFAFSKTLDSYTAYRTLKSAEGMEAVSVSRSYTERRAREVDVLYRRLEVDTLRWKNALWNCASALSKTHASMVASFPPVQSLVVQDKPLAMQTVGFKGSFKDLMLLLKDISQLKDIGLPHSLRLVKKARDKEIVLTIDMVGRARGN
jgi:hypothetical protein